MGLGEKGFIEEEKRPKKSKIDLDCEKNDLTQQKMFHFESNLKNKKEIYLKVYSGVRN
jgi:hypothetical protein